MYWIRSAGEPGEKIAELGQIFTNQLCFFIFLIIFVSLVQIIPLISVYWIISAETPGEVQNLSQYMRWPKQAKYFQITCLIYLFVFIFEN